MLFMILIFGGLLPVLFATFKYWKRTHVKVNCWFCGLNNIVLKKCQDGWMCKHCEQYNGFKPDGDYNRDIPAQWNSSLNGKSSFCSSPRAYTKSSNGLCQECNRNQELKVAQLASFEPINPENFDHEIANFSYHLDRAYRLCPPCESVLEDTLSRKKTHVLDINLQLTGKKTLGSSSSTKAVLGNILAQTSALMTTTIAVMLAMFKLSTLSTDNLVPEFTDISLSSNLLSYPVSFLSSYLAPSNMCTKPKVIPTSEPISESVFGFFNADFISYLDPIGSYLFPLGLAGLAFQAMSSWHSGSRTTLLLWTALSGTIFLEHHKLFSADYVPIFHITQLVLLFLTSAHSWFEMVLHKSKPASPSKKSPRGGLSNLQKGKPESIHKFTKLSSDVTNSIAQVPHAASKPMAPRSLSLGGMGQDHSALDAPNYLVLPPRPPSVSSSHTLTSAAALNKSFSPPEADVLSSVTQEDARSDASADSAFSNTDSINLDGAELLNTSQHVGGKKRSTEDDDVHSLIEGLSIGTLSSRRNLRKSSVQKANQHVNGRKRSSLLCPPKLTNIMNESKSGIWRNTGHLSAEVPDRFSTEPLNRTITESLNQTLSRPSSPSGSVHSQVIAQTVEPPRSPSSPFQQMVPAWNPPMSPRSTLSVCVPPNHLAGNPGFGNPVTSLPSSPMSQVIYTPYGVYHQMVGPFNSPAMFMMPPQSPAFSNRSPASSYGSQFSPQSFSTSSHKDMNSFCDSDVDSSPKTSRRRTKPLSSSFLESVWQSRFAIMYTTLCYLLLGFVMCMFSFSGLPSKFLFKIGDWKQSLLSFIS